MKNKQKSSKFSNYQDIKQPLLINHETPHVTPSIKFFQLFKFADTKDIFYMIIGSIGALGSGASLPLFSFIFADVTTVYQDPDSVHKALKSAVQFFILGAATFILNFIGVNMWIITGERQSNRYRKYYYKLLLNQEIKWYDEINPNSLSSQISSQITAIQEAIGEKISVLQSIFVTCILGFFLAYFRNWRVSLVLTAVFPLLVLAGIINTKAVEISQNKNRKTYSEAGAISQQAFSLIKNIKSLVGQNFQLQKFTTRLFHGKTQADKLNLFFSISNGIVIFLFVGTYSIAFWYGKQVLLYNNGDFNDIMAALLCVMIGGLSISPASGAIKNLGEGVNAIKKIIQLQNRKITLIQKQDGEKIEQINEIIFQNVTFNYKPQIQQRNVLQNFSIKIPKNKVTAICGQSGSGKSTIVQLIERFYDPLTGRILVNGKDLKQMDVQSYRRQIGYVGQEPSLFSFSIKENLLLAKQTATDQQIVDALKLSNAYQFVRKMQHGINTFVGASGTQISGGQKQRIAIARAILKNPSLYIFDEATSALDRKNQRIIQETLKKISKNNTTIVIAHRLSTIQEADNIIVLNKGMIAEQGTHKQLYNKKGYYYDLIKNQIQASQNEQQEEQQVFIKKTKKSSSTVNRTYRNLQQKQQLDVQWIKKEEQVFYKIFNQSKQSLVHYILGSIHALINGLILPIFALIFSHLITLLYEIDVFYTHHLNNQITYYSLSFVGLGLVGGITTFGYNLSFSKIGQKIIYRLRLRLFNKLLKQQIKFYEEEQNNPGALSAKLAQDTYLIKNFISNVIGISILNFSISITGIVLSLAFDWAIALIVLGLSPIIVIVAVLNIEKMKIISMKSEQSYRQAGNLISDTVCNIRTTKSFGKKSALQKLFNDSLTQPSQIAKEKAFNSGVFQAITQSAILFIYGLVFYLAAVINVQQKKNPTNIFIAVFSIIFAAYGISNNARFITDVAKSKNAGVNIFQIIQSKDQYQRFVEEGGTQKPALLGDIEFRNVSFKYPSRKKKVFNNLNFKINKNTKVAFVGSSGCGKSTIFQLLLRFYDIDSGEILIDGKNIKSFDIYYLRQQYGLVSQEPSLFIGNIEQNIKYKNLNKNLQEVIQVAKIANAHLFIQTLSEQKYRKQVGNKGGQLSGGQKQRIAIARCILAKPNIFMFDESTSALDLETQKTVFQNLKIVTQGKTTLSIAHRISTIVDSDMILVFDNGKIVQSGTYDDLTSAKGYFYRLQRGQN